ncbi:putative membrane protein [Tibeticola sediminis]|uniref:Putative membrane protein n=1 Tax=Tibeticola sediminis TaxID=1917811 RepID=A0A3N4UT63_9BURK|nr:heparan-alpha-glucosaminide N-acetyltransferase [Tibeticola sediminis]RPE70721.1 putative membrane protein [Tibeticola sediminis]
MRVPRFSKPSATRFEIVDALRGAAVVWMTVYHFCFDLRHFGYLQSDFYRDPFWTLQRTVIVSLFLWTAGLSQAIAWHQGQGWARFWRRWAQVAGCALLVSAGSYLMFPRSFIWFGVLHGLAVMLVIARLSAPVGRWLWPLGALAIATPFIAQAVHSTLGYGPFPWIFDERWLAWLGWVSRKPITEDYVPVFPWLGVMLWGVAAGQWLMRARPQWLQVRVPAPARPLVTLGRWSLTWYMLHQPVLIGALMAWQALR